MLLEPFIAHEGVYMSADDITEVKKTLQIYFDGNKELNSTKILSVWDKDLKIISTDRTQGPNA